MPGCGEVCEAGLEEASGEIGFEDASGETGTGDAAGETPLVLGTDAGAWLEIEVGCKTDAGAVREGSAPGAGRGAAGPMGGGS